MLKINRRKKLSCDKFDQEDPINCILHSISFTIANNSSLWSVEHFLMMICLSFCKSVPKFGTIWGSVFAVSFFKKHIPFSRCYFSSLKSSDIILRMELDSWQREDCFIEDYGFLAVDSSINYSFYTSGGVKLSECY